MLAAWVALSTTACQWGGYTPVEKAPPALQVPTLPLALGETSHNELDCPAGNCQVRFRMRIEQPGELLVSLQSRHSGDNIGIIIVLEDSIGRILDRYNMQNRKPPLIVKGAVQPGPHTVLVQAVGGRLTYDIQASLRAGGRLEVFEQPARRLQPAAPTRAQYGADSASNPETDFRPYRRYAFAQDPKEQLAAAEPGQSVGNPFLARQIQLALQAELNERGYSLASISEADFLVDFSAGGQSTTWYSVRGVLRSEPYGNYFQLWGGLGGIINAHSYQDGTLTIDLIDPTSGDLVWHGWSTEPVNRFDDDKETIRRFVKAVLDNFPPK